MNNYFGIIGIQAKGANWNAGFDKYPKQLTNGTIFGSDKALKYSMRAYWEMLGLPVLYFKSFVSDKDMIRPLKLAERYETLFGEKLDKKNQAKILKNILTATDARQFGFTFAEEGANLNQTGTVQIGIGLNIYNNTATESQKILSPFVNAKGDNDKATSLGDMVFVDEAHYCYPFSVCPRQLDETGIGVEPYSEKDYQNFLIAAANGATALNSCAKMGCSNEYLVTVETEGDLYLNNLSEYVTYADGCLDITGLVAYLKKYGDRILSVKAYYNRDTVTIGEYEGVELHDLAEI